eukprot:PhM_4_TR4141/c0_g1_i1/m.22036
MGCVCSSQTEALTTSLPNHFPIAITPPISDSQQQQQQHIGGFTLSSSSPADIPRHNDDRRVVASLRNFLPPNNVSPTSMRSPRMMFPPAGDEEEVSVPTWSIPPVSVDECIPTTALRMDSLRLTRPRRVSLTNHRANTTTTNNTNTNNNDNRNYYYYADINPQSTNNNQKGEGKSSGEEKRAIEDNDDGDDGENSVIITSSTKNRIMSWLRDVEQSVVDRDVIDDDVALLYEKMGSTESYKCGHEEEEVL